MFKPMVDAALQAASVLVTLPEYRVLATVRDETGRREVFVETPSGQAACPSYGVSRPVNSRIQMTAISTIAWAPWASTDGEGGVGDKPVMAPQGEQLVLACLTFHVLRDAGAAACVRRAKRDGPYPSRFHRRSQQSCPPQWP